MKTALKIISFIVLIMIGMSSVTKAQNTKMCFYVNITDSCSGTWSGGYCIRCYVVCGSNNYCLYSHCYSTWTTGTNQFALIPALLIPLSLTKVTTSMSQFVEIRLLQLAVERFQDLDLYIILILLVVLKPSTVTLK